MRSRLIEVANQALPICDRWHAYKIYLYVLVIFAASRLVVIISINFGTLLVPATNPGKWDAGPAWYHRLLRCDAACYASIIRAAYPSTHHASIPPSPAFYP